jgi:hypothetical protein
MSIGPTGALALGLELAGVRFLWALRKPTGGERPQLPDRFEGHVGGRGVVRVLGHAAEGAFMTHAGGAPSWRASYSATRW